MICAAAVLLVGGFVLFRYIPLRNKIKTVNQTKAAKMRDRSEGLAQGELLPVLEEKLEKLKQSIGNYEARIPQERNLGVFLGTIADLMNQHNLKDHVVKPGDRIEAEELNCIPVNIQCKGKFADVFEFYKQLQAMDRLVRIEQIKLTNGTDFSGEVTMETKAVIYYGADVEQG